ncbi:acyltransferase domain-containing protein, partial [Dactylosporangium sp. NPDC005572]|uniref:acyltransferase domain-containing protein n=1 Tax=Dactylosporangium sp. NPDC005572 TaxID=3156889 RepID=UPI0033A1D5CB
MTPVASPRHLLPDGRMGVLLSGDSPAQLRAEAAAVAAYLREHPRVTPAEVADMLARSRRVRRHRALAAVSGPADLVSALDAVAANEPDDRATVGERPARPRRIALVYPGQGSQRPGMGRLFYTSSSAYAEVVDACEDILRREHSMSVRDYLLGDLPADAPQAGDVRTVQPALLAQMLGITAMWRSVGVVPHAVIGHSQGEIAAAHVSGAIPLADALRVVVTRARLLAAFGTDEHRVALLGISPKDCTRLLARSDGRAELSVVNAPEAVCVSGDAGPVAELVDTVRASGRFAREIGLSFPAHTSRMWALKDDLITDLHHHLEYPTFRPPAIECFSSALGGERITGGLDAGRYWFLNLRNVVRFDEAVEAALAAGSTVFVEAAEHPTLQSAVEATVGAAGLPERPLVVGTSRRDAQDLSEFTRALGAVAVDDELFDWSVLRGAADAARTLPLPGFPNTVLTERPMWAVKQPAARPAITPSQVADGRPPRRWVEAWTPLRRRALIRPTRVVVLDPTGNCAEPAAAIAAQAARHGAVGCRWEPGLPLHRDDVAVVLLPPEPVMDGRAASARLGAYLSGSVEWLPLVDAAGACWVVTVNGEAVGEGEVPQLWHAAAGVASRCLVAQCPSTRFGHLDIDAAVLESPTGAGEILAAVHTAGESELALRDGVLHAKRLERADRDTEPGDLTEVVIVGGTGRVGLEFAQDLARRGAGRITLLNRSGERRDLAGEVLVEVAEDDPVGRHPLG